MITETWTMSRRTLTLLCACLFCLPTGPALGADEAAPAPELDGTVLTAEERQLQLEAFDQVWTTVRDKHYDPELGGLDWEGVERELRPRMAEARTAEEARAILRQMVSRLGQSHFNIIPREAYEELDPSDDHGARGGVTGMEVRVVDGRALVTSVAPASPAAAAGIAPGWEILRIGDLDLPPRLRALAAELADSSLKELALSDGVAGRLAGDVGEALAVELLDGEEQTVARTLTLAPPRGRRIQVANLPPVYVWVETRRLAPDVGYITFNAFLAPSYVMEEINRAMESFLDADGVIIDLRGNQGGLGAMAMGLMGWLVDGPERHLLGTVRVRGHELKVLVQPRPRTFAGPVAVLVDGLSASASEFFAAGLQDLGRAAVVGSRTSGAVLGSAIETLPSGDRFQYVFSSYVSAETGRALEGVGVVPDIAAVPSRPELLVGRDPVLEAARSWIASQSPERPAAGSHP